MSQQIGSIHYSLDLDDKQYKEKLNSASASFDAAGDKMKGIGMTLTATVTAPITAIGVKSFEAAASIQDAMGAADQIFKNASGTMKNWANELPTYYGIARGEALEYSNMMGSMLQNIGGLSEDMAAKQAQDLIQLAGDLTAMYGGTTADAVRALTGSLKGNNTMLDNYGMVATEAMISTKALEMGLIKEGQQMDSNSKQAATLALIMEQSSAAQGQAAREAGGASGTIRAFGTEMKNLSIQIGEVLIPIFLPFIAKIKELVTMFSGLDENQKKIIVTFGLVAAAIGPILLIVGTLVSTIGTILPVVGAVVAALSSPIGIIALLIGALVALGVKFGWFSEIINRAKEFIQPLIEQFWTIIDAVKIQMFEAFEQIKPSIVELQEAFRKLEPLFKAVAIVLGVVLYAAFQAIMLAISVLANVVTAVVPRIVEIFTAGMNIIGDLIQFIVALFTGDWKKAWESIISLGQNVQTYLNGFVLIILDLIKGLVKGVVDWFMSLYNQLVGHSIIPDIVNGIINWFGKVYAGVVSALKGVYDAITEPFLRAWRKVSEIADKIKESLKKISPFHKSSPSLVEYVEMGTRQISGLYNDMFSKISSYSGETRGDLVDSVSGNMEGSAGSGVVINFNPSGIVARSRSEWRAIIADGIEAINEELRARGIDELGGGKIYGLSTIK